MTQNSPRLTRPRLTILAAVAANGVIGRGNELPWYLPDDLKRFKALTLGHPVVMGRKTFDSILARNKKPLPGRRNLVVSRTLDDATGSGAEIYASLAEALEAGGKNESGKAPEEIFVIGGAAIYALALPLADRLQMTEIATAVEGDVHFPPYDRSQFSETAREAGPPADLRYDYATYDRIVRP